MDGDNYVVNGQKMWTSFAVGADYGLLIARTDWDVPKHRGISFFMFPMRQPGVEVRPIHQITGESEFNEVFITDAVVPAENLIGPLGGGWGVLQTALGYERRLMGDLARTSRTARKPTDARQDTNSLVGLARSYGKIDDGHTRQQIARIDALVAVNKWNTRRAKASGGARGGDADGAWQDRDVPNPA